MSYTSSYLNSKYWCNLFLTTAWISSTEFPADLLSLSAGGVSETPAFLPSKGLCRTASLQAQMTGNPCALHQREGQDHPLIAGGDPPLPLGGSRIVTAVLEPCSELHRLKARWYSTLNPTSA